MEFDFAAGLSWVVSMSPGSRLKQVPCTGGSGSLYYLLADHLGSTTKVLDASGVSVYEQKYWPFGAPRSTTGTSPTDQLFTGQRKEPTGGLYYDRLGLYNYGARMYSTVLGRFVSADRSEDESVPVWCPQRRVGVTVVRAERRRFALRDASGR